jgi:hypothetical protein
LFKKRNGTNGFIYLPPKLPSKYLIRNLLPCEVCNDSVKSERIQPKGEGEKVRRGEGEKVRR